MDFTKQPIKTSVVACIIDEKERVLLTRRCIPPFCGQWVMPGGKIDKGEAILAALHREVLEEVGIGIRIDALVDVFEHIGVGERNDHFIILYYRAHPLSLDLAPNGEEVTEAIWVEHHRLPAFHLPPGTRHILSKIFPDLGWGQGAPPVRHPEAELPGGQPLPQL